MSPRRSVWLLGLPWQDQVLLAEATLALLAVKLGIRVAGVRRCVAFLGSNRPRRDNRPDHEDLTRIGLAVRRAGAPFRLNCLPQSLAVAWMLRRRGVAAELRFGAKLDAGALEGHAWVAAPALDWSFDLCPAGGYAPMQNGSPG